VTFISQNQPQILPSLGLPSLPSVEEAVSVHYEDDSDEDDEIDSSLLDDYVLLELEQGAPIVSEELMEVSVITIVSNSSSPPPSSLVEAGGTEGKMPTFFTDCTTLDVSSLPLPQVPVAAWWEG